MSEIARVPVIARVGVDLAKQVIQVHAVDALGRRAVTRTFKRDQFFAWCAQLPVGCVVAMEACSSAHHWARKLRALGLDARLIAANFVTPYRMEGKNGKTTPPTPRRSARRRRGHACASCRSRPVSSRA